jgi:hypothetical protein
MLRRLVVLCAASVFSLVGQSLGAGGLQPKNVTVCILAKQSGKYDGALVTLNARIESDGYEHVTLMDEACVGEGVGLGEMQPRTNVKAIRKLMKVVEKVYTGQRRRPRVTVTATIVGYFHAKPSDVLPVLLPLDASNIAVREAVPLGPEKIERKF